jgi:hypothetical protein
MSINNLYPDISPSLLLDFANVKKLDPRITFARASTGAYYDGQTVTKAEENLFSYSEDFTNSIWIKSSVSITANDTAAPDGTVTADKYQGSAVNLLYRSPPSAGTYAFSCYIKAGTATTATLSCTISLRGIAAEFNLSAGTTSGIEDGQNGSELGISADSASITNAANGWYRCVINGITINQVRSMVINSGDKSATSTGTIYLWGAQLEQRDAATAYTPTTTQPITNYIPTLLSAPANSARFDHNPVTGESLGLLVEEQRTNLFTYSEDFGNAAWVKTNATIQSNVAIASDGTLTGDKLIPNIGTTSSGYVYKGYSISAGSYTFTVYAKAGEYPRVILWEGAVTANSATFDLISGTVAGTGGTGTATITPVGNGWYRCSMTATYSAIGGLWIIRPQSNGNIGPFTPFTAGDGYSGIYIWGAQLEADAFQTSYIKTEASQVTRSADSASMTGANFSDWYNDAEGTLYAEASLKANGYCPIVMLFNSSGATQANQVLLGTNSAQAYAEYGAIGGSIGLAATSTVIPNTFFKSSIAFTNSNVSLSANGGTVAINTTIPTTPIVNSLRFAHDSLGRRKAMTIKKLSYYPQRLSNAQLQAITS